MIFLFTDYLSVVWGCTGSFSKYIKNISNFPKFPTTALMADSHVLRPWGNYFRVAVLNADCSAKVHTHGPLMEDFSVASSVFYSNNLKVIIVRRIKIKLCLSYKNYKNILNTFLEIVECDSLPVKCVLPTLCGCWVTPQHQWRTEESALWTICPSLSKASLLRTVLVSDIPLWYLGSLTETVRNTHGHTVYTEVLILGADSCFIQGKSPTLCSTFKIIHTL